MTKDKKIDLLCLIVVAGFFIAAAFHYFMGMYLGKGYPYNTFLFRPDDHFMDFFNPLRGSFDRDPYNPQRINFIGGYFPFGYTWSFLFSLIHPKKLSFGLFIGSFLVYIAMYVAYFLFQGSTFNSRKYLIIITLSFMTYPILMVIDRANFDISVFMFLSLSLFFYQKGKFVLSALLLAAPIAMKGYPAILVLLFLIDRRYKDILLIGAVVFVLTVGSLAIFKDGLFIEFQKMLASFRHAYSIAFEDGSLIRFNSSLFIFLLVILKPVFPALASSVTFNLVYLFFAILITGLAVGIMFINNYPFWRKVQLLIILMILLPQSSADYRLIMLYIPLLLFLSLKEQTTLDRIITLLFGLLLIPKAYIVFFADVNIGIVLNPLLLLVLFVFTLIPPKNVAIKAQTSSP